MDATAVKQRLSEAADRARPAAQRVAEASAPRVEAAAEAARHAADTARPAVEKATQRLSDAAHEAREHAPEWWDTVVDFVGDVLENVGERGKELASHIEPPRAEKRRRLLTGIGIFSGGFALGAVVGFLAGRGRDREPDLWEHAAPAPAAPSPVQGVTAAEADEGDGAAGDAERAG